MTQFKPSQPSWPHLADHFNETLDIASHHLINKFWYKNGYIPLLQASPTVKKRAEELKAKYIGRNKKMIVVNVRQRQKTELPGDVFRDADWDQWLKFFSATEKKYDDVMFVLCGPNLEIDQDIHQCKNVFLPRQHGLNLSDELGLLFSCDLFLGSSSGYAAAATFSDRPYIITSHLKAAAGAVGIKLSENKYPFANSNQTIQWEQEDFTELTAAVDKLVADQGRWQ